MDEFFVQLSELARAGGTLQITPDPRAATMLATRGVIFWTNTTREFYCSMHKSLLQLYRVQTFGKCR